MYGVRTISAKVIFEKQLFFYANKGGLQGENNYERIGNLYVVNRGKTGWTDRKMSSLIVREVLEERKLVKSNV